MATFTAIPVSEAKTQALPPRRQAQEQYHAYVMQILENPGQAGRLELGDEDKSITIRARLKAAAKQEGVVLTIQRRKDAVYFWLNSREMFGSEPEDVDDGDDEDHTSATMEMSEPEPEPEPREPMGTSMRGRRGNRH